MDLPLILIKSSILHWAKYKCFVQSSCIVLQLIFCGSFGWFAIFLPCHSLSLLFLNLSPSLFGAEPNVKCNGYCGVWNPSEEEEVNSGTYVERSNLRAGFWHFRRKQCHRGGQWWLLGAMFHTPVGKPGEKQSMVVIPSPSCITKVREQSQPSHMFSLSYPSRMTAADSHVENQCWQGRDCNTVLKSWWRGFLSGAPNKKVPNRMGMLNETQNGVSMLYCSNVLFNTQWDMAMPLHRGMLNTFHACNRNHRLK